MLGQFFDSRNRRRKGGLLRARNLTATVQSASGVVYTLPPTQMLPPVSFANKSGSANLTLPDANQRITAIVAIPEGQNQSISFEAISGDGLRVPYTVTLNVPMPVLGPLTLGISSVAENMAIGALVGLLIGRTAGSTLTLIDTAGNRFAMNGGGDGIVIGATGLNFEAAQGHNFIVEETHPTASNSPRQSTIHLDVMNVLEVVLTTPSLSASSVSEDAAPGTVIGDIGGLPVGANWVLTDDAGGRVAQSGNQIVVGMTDISYSATPTFNIGIRIVHPDASNAPFDCTLPITVLNGNMTLGSTSVQQQYSQPANISIPISGHTGAVTFSGLPYGLSATIINGNIVITGTPE